PISIHASREGCDETLNVIDRKQKYFNPRIPRGMRPIVNPIDSLASYFNPRIPRGMRPYTKSFSARQINFNPRIPRGMRPIFDAYIPEDNIFQSTHPARDATKKGSGTRGVLPISIHASREGCDPDPAIGGEPDTYFNPRIPRGMRLVGRMIMSSLLYFNPRIPRGMRPSHMLDF
ncbi:hypothetical protein B0G52_1381, partial [Cohnella sp. SGD-V74]